MLNRWVAPFVLAFLPACSVDYLDAETDRPLTDAGSGGSGATGGSSGDCTTVADDYTGDPSTDLSWVIGKFEGNDRVALRFTPSASAVVCGAEVLVQASATPIAGTLHVTIREQVKAIPSDPGKPGPIIGPASSAVDCSTISTAPQLLRFDGLATSVTADTPYFLVLEREGTNDETRYVFIHHGATPVADGQSYSNDVENWSLNGFEQGLLKTFR